MLRVVFGWHGDIEELIRDERKYNETRMKAFTNTW